MGFNREFKIVVFALVLVVMVACSSLPGRGAPTSSGESSLQTPIAGDVSVCDMMPASEYRQYFGLPVTMFQFYHHQGSGDDGLVKSSFSCTLLMKGDRSFLVSIDYRETGAIEFAVSTTGERPTFEEISAMSGASSFALEDHEGDGIIFKDRGGRFASIWRYPGGEVVSIGFRPLDEDDSSAYVEKAKNFTRRIVPLVPELAT